MGGCRKTGWQGSGVRWKGSQGEGERRGAEGLGLRVECVGEAMSWEEGFGRGRGWRRCWHSTCGRFVVRDGWRDAESIPAEVVISAFPGPSATMLYGSPGSLGESGTRSHDAPESRVCSRMAGLPMIQPSPS